MADKVGANDSYSVRAGQILQAIYDGAIEGDFSKNQSSVKAATQIGVGLIPIAGQAADLRDTAAALNQVSAGENGGWSNMAFALLGWIPLAGDFAKSVRRSGLRATVSAVREAFTSIGDTWRVVSRFSEEKLGTFEGLFYKPAVNMKARGLPAGTYGVTSRWGDIEVSRSLSAETKKSTLDHETVHAFFSPKLKYGQNLRANIGVLGYAESHLLRRVEEGLAEGWARWKAEGVSGVAKGWRFPLENPYDIDPERLSVERDLLIGAATTAAAAGAELADAVAPTEIRDNA